MARLHFFSHLPYAALALVLTCVGGFAAPMAVHASPVDLSPAPPNLTTSVDPNIVVTFDDSGSMGDDYMGDHRPFDDGSWNGPWRCANVLDPSATRGYKSLDMNGVYYNPKTDYEPPLYADGLSFVDADDTLKAVWRDGVTANRPLNASGTGNTTNFTQQAKKGWRWNGNNWVYGVFPSGRGYYSLNGPNDRPNSAYDYQYGDFPAAWACPSDWRSPLDSGPYYYIYTGPALTLDTYGSPTSDSLNDLYNDDNWTAKAVPSSQYQNWANWYAYYRTRNLMTRTALSRVFGSLGGNLRVAWQNINDGDFDLDDDVIIAHLINTSSSCNASQVNPETEQQDTGADCYRDAMFNWIYDTGASGSTPDRSAAKRAGAFFSRSLTKDALDPYWNGKANTADDDTIAADLSCRQNYHMLVTDGYWNRDDGIKTPDDSSSSSTIAALPDGQSYDGGASTQTVIYKSGGDDDNDATLADIAFYYWANDLEGDLDDGITPYLPDKSTGITGTTAFGEGDDPLLNKEIYWNPKNDPATWQHVVQYVVTLGINGELHYSDDTDCTDATSDACLLRKGQTNSSGDIGWPETDANGGSGVKQNIDDMWHAALVSRGDYFSASNPTALVNHLTQIFHSIAARSGSAVANTVNSGVWTTSSTAYLGTYNSADWSGSVTAYEQLLTQSTDADGNVTSKISLGAEQWDANCLLTGGGCMSGGTTFSTARAPGNRVILTAKKNANGTWTGEPFRWNNLSASEKLALNADPATDRNSTALVNDGLGDDRLEWLRGDRSNEGTELRSRGSVMGAVIRSQPLYVAYPDSGYHDTFPAGNSSDATAVAPENAKPYEDFVSAHKDRTPILYAGANDGMLHALDAETGRELFAYVPASIYWRVPPAAATASIPAEIGVPLLSKLTAKTDFSFRPTVDNTPVKRDVFFGGAWHTLLVGTLGMGGRGVYALDITNPASITEASADTPVLWEFNSASTGGANLGYTYGQPEIARLATGKWAVLVPGGYFPQDIQDPNHYAAGADNTFSSLFVLDAQTGALIRELKTSDAAVGSTTTSYGLATPVLGDYNADQVDDVAFAGDLMGNLWRFDLGDPDPDNWQIDLVFQGALNEDDKPTQPITVKPRLFPDPVTNLFMVVFGTGKYLGAVDRLRTGTPTQAIYGIREQGASGSTSFPANYYPIDGDSPLVTQTLTVEDGVRMLTNLAVPAGADDDPTAGWKIPLDVREGERVVQRAGALFSTNQALITTLIPAGDDPCNPDRAGAQILISATTGGSGSGVPSLGEPVEDPDTGEVIKAPVGENFPSTGDGGGGDNPPTLPSISDSGSGQPVVVEPGGCRGITTSGLNIPMACWRRRSWHVLQVDQ